MIELKVTGEDEVWSFSKNLRAALSPTSLVPRVIEIARLAGKTLHKATVQACVEAIYDHPNFPSLSEFTPSNPNDPELFGGNEEERTHALLDAHILEDHGLVQIVEIDPYAAAIDPHRGRETVLDYAIPVHEGYTQFVMGRDTGVFHPGRFWMDVAAIEADPVIASFVMTAMSEVIISLLENC